jgi:hypothetical protein
MSINLIHTRHKLASFLIVLTLALSFVVPAYAQETSAPDEATFASDATLADATEDGTDLETFQRTDCAGTLTIDGPTGTATGGTPIVGWFADLTAPFNPGGPLDLYRGDTRIASTATGLSRDPAHLRPDVDTALGLSDGRTGWVFELDWSTQPGGMQTYTVRGRTDCEWIEQRFSVNVNPAPPPPPPTAASLSISDESRTLSNYSGYYGTSGTGTSCIQYNTLGQCTQYSSVGSTGTSCIQYNTLGQCIQYSSVGTGYYGSGYGYGSNQSDLNYEFTVTLSPAASQTVQVDYATADGSATSGDYSSTSGTLTFGAGETTKTITVRVYNRAGSYQSGDRDFYVRLTNPRGASLSDSEGRGLIRRSSSYSSGSSGCTQYDVNGNCISYGGSYGYGGNCGVGSYWNGTQCIYTGTGGTGAGVSFAAGSTAMTCIRGSICNFTIQQTGGTTATVTYTVSTGSATAGAVCGGTTDVAPTSGSVVVGANSSASISLSTCAGSLNSLNEVFTVTLVSTTSGFIGSPSSATGTFPSI